MCLRENQCWSCKHYRKELNTVVACDAFPNPIETDWNPFSCAIPKEIIDGTFDHTKPYPGDNGIQYEPLDD